jgi:ubiquinone/menaquinone biosynthesis C-methylase UbiE
VREEIVSKVQADFDRLALLSGDEWNHNSHYHPCLLKHIPQHIHTALEIGCGTGAFSRLLAQRADRVLALDLSSQMILIAKQSSPDYSNLTYETADAAVCEFLDSHFDCIASIATLHHMSLEAMIPKMKRALKPGGVLLILDLYALERWGWRDVLRNAAAVPYSLCLKLLKTGRLRSSREVREAWEEHGKTDHYLTPAQVRAACVELTGAQIKFHVLWRYSVIWKK